MFKIDIFWTAWTPQVTTRILRDCLALQRLAVSQRAEFVIGCDENAHQTLKTLGMQVTSDLTAPNMVRVYLANGEITDDIQERIPECDDVDYITLVSPTPVFDDTSADAPDANQVDPYAGLKLFKDWKSIPETLPLSKAPPKGPSDPMFSPWL